LLVAALVVLVAELFVWWRYDTNIANANNFLSLKFPQREEPTRAIVYEKTRVFSAEAPQIVQSGDSSGLMGIHAEIVEEYLPPGVRMANMSCCFTLGHRGPYAIFSHFLENTPNVRMIVLYVTPAGNLPTQANRFDGGAAHHSLGNDVYDQYQGWRTALALPSLFLREKIATRTYNAPLYWVQGKPMEDRIPLTSHPLFNPFLANLHENRGYIADPETQIDDRKAWGAWPDMEECVYDVEPYDSGSPFGDDYATYIEQTYSAFAELARRHKVKLVIAYQVVPCPLGSGSGSQAAREAIARFKQRYPEVEFPFDVVTHWDVSKFAITPHVRDIHSEELSRRLGEALGPIYRSLPAR